MRVPLDLEGVAVLAAALGCGGVAGVFFAFSSFVMPALVRLPAPQGIVAMQSINVAVINVSFMGLLFGTAMLCLGLAIVAGLHWQRLGAAWTAAGCLLYLLGSIGTTVVFNVPRNDLLATLDPAAPDAAAVWLRFVSEWTAANHVRTLASAAACAMLILALVARRTDLATP